MTALISAEAWLGASGWARGSHTCSGTRPDFAAKPTTSRTNATLPATDDGSALASTPKPTPPVCPTSTANPARIATRLRCVMTAYQSAASRAAGLRACSASTRTVEAPAMSSQASRKLTTSAAAGTSCIPRRNTASAAHWLREADGPCA